MRILTYFGALLCALLAVIITPVVAAAAALEAAPHVGPGGLALLAGAAALGVGAVYFVQKGKSLFAGGLKTEGDEVKIEDEEDRQRLLEQGVIGKDPPKAEPAAPPPPPHDVTQTQEDLMNGLRRVNERLRLLEKQVAALQEQSAPDLSGTASELLDAYNEANPDAAIDPSEIEGTGTGGKVTKPDVEKAIEERA